MAKASDNLFPSVLFAQQTADVTAPATGDWRLYFKSGGLYAIDSSGTVIGPFTSSTPTFHGCRLYMSVGVTLTTATITPLGFDSETFDTDTYHDTTTNNSRITIPTGLGGKYLVTSRVDYTSTSSAGTHRQNRLHVNGVAQITKNWTPLTGPDTQVDVTDIVSLAAGDYIETAGYQDSGGNLAVQGTASGTYFGAVYLGA